jgi:glycosyltransferase involved in cell wall biosynthesis
MRISIYTFVKDGIYFDYHIVQMLKQHLPLADEIIVNEGYSSDETYEKITNLDPKVKIFRDKWDLSDDTWHAKFKDNARKHCTGDWCILLDADEFIPEWEFEKIRSYLKKTERLIIPLRFIHFYGNYKVYNTDPKKFSWPLFKYVIHRNLKDIEVWGDGSNVRLKGTQLKIGNPSDYFECHHFGFVRNPARLRHKWRTLQYNSHPMLRTIYGRKMGLIFDLFPYNWFSKEYISELAMYEGPVVKAVKEDPKEFVRDNFALYDFLSTHPKL